MDERGFTLIELLVVMILIGILAAIALAVFLNQKDKGNDAASKSDLTNLSHVVQACNASNEQRDDFRDCDSQAKISSSLPYDTSIVANEPGSGACTTPDPDARPPAADIPAQGKVAVIEARPNCFVAVGASKSGNVFWLVRGLNGSVARGCTTHNVDGCPADGEWAG